MSEPNLLSIALMPLASRTYRGTCKLGGIEVSRTNGTTLWTSNLLHSFAPRVTAASTTGLRPLPEASRPAGRFISWLDLSLTEMDEASMDFQRYSLIDPNSSRTAPLLSLTFWDRSLQKQKCSSRFSIEANEQSPFKRYLHKHFLFTRHSACPKTNPIALKHIVT